MSKSQYAPVRSVRISPEVWESAKRRATSEGKTISQAMTLLVEAYSRGMLDLPRVQLVYTPKK